MHAANSVAVLDHIIQFFQSTLDAVLFRPILCHATGGVATSTESAAWKSLSAGAGRDRLNYEFGVGPSGTGPM